MTTLYRLRDADGGLLYVGIAEHWIGRLSQHRGDKSWWADVARVDVEEFPDRRSALVAEERAIKAEHPVHNVMHNGKLARPRASRHEIYWKCHECGQPIPDGEGYVECPASGDGNWFARHRRCDPAVGVTSYWIAVERIRSRRDLHAWTDHLVKKNWFDEFAWWEMVDASAVGGAA